jgi:NADPH2:quinone reductase
MAGEPHATIDMRRVLGRRLTLTGSTLRPRTVQEKTQIAAALRANVWPLIEQQRVRPLVYRTFPLAAAADAHRLMESGDHVGKLVLII